MDRPNHDFQRIQTRNKPSRILFSDGLTPDCITEGQELHTFVELHRHSSASIDDDHKPAPPRSPRGRSQSVFEGDRRSNPGLFPQIGPGNSDSTDTIVKNYESLPKLYRRSNRHLSRLNTQFLAAVKSCNASEVQKLLDAGANPNATCHTEFISACHIAALTGNGILSLLLEHGAEGHRTDRHGRTPLHLAAWSGHTKHVAALLGFPEELQKKLQCGLSLEAGEEIKNLNNSALKEVVDVRCDLGGHNIKVPKPWCDNIDHSCKDIELPFLQPGWTPLHAASSAARHGCCWVLLAAGAEPCIRDLLGRTPLDVAGSGCLYGLHGKQPSRSTEIDFSFTEVVKIFLTKLCKRGSFKKNLMLDTPLHTAVELESLEAIQLLLQAGISPRDLNRAGLTPLHVCVKKQLKPHLQAFIYNDPSEDQRRTPGIVNARDKDGYTVLHYAVLNNWAAGVCLALEAQANIVLPAVNGETPLHTAAALGNIDILKEILICAKKSKVIDVLNQKGQTALYKAILNGHTECVKMMLKEGASIEITLPRRCNVFHVAAQCGYKDILKVLLDHDYTFTRVEVNVTIDDKRGYGPIHFAIEYDHPECVKLLLSKNAFISLKTSSGWHRESRPLHIAARKNNLEIAKIILKFEPSTIREVDAFGWTPLHTAGYFASRDVIRFLIHEGSNLSAMTNGPKKFKRTAIDIIMNNLSKPTEFFESIFDMNIHTFQNTDNELDQLDPETKVKVNYNVLVPKISEESEEMKLTVIEALLKSGNRYGQRRLLIHPLVESFLCLKWKALVPFFYVTLFLYAIFVATLTIFLMSEYFYKDNETEEPFILDTTFWTCALYIIIAIIGVQEILLLSASIKHYIFQLETWVNLTSIALATILPVILAKYPIPPKDYTDWPRHISTITVLLCWLDVTFLLSRFPSWGYYLLMFGKVSANVLKILLTFAFLIAGFALSFMIQFHHQGPFENPWDALVKTMVMMTSEFDYDDLVDKKDPDNPKSSLQSLVMIRLLFLIFLVLAAIVLMNLMVGVAVNDLNNLEVLGHIMQIEKQVEFLASLETWVLNKMFFNLLPAKWQYNLQFANKLNSIILKPCEPSWSYYKAIPAHVRDAIFEKAITQKKNESHHMGYETIRKQLVEIYDTVKKAEEFPRKLSIHRLASKQLVAPKRLTDTDMIVVRIKRQIDDVNTKVDMIMQLLINQSLRD